MQRRALLIVFLFLNLVLGAQEVVLPIESLFSTLSTKREAVIDTLSLPFFDDFSSLQISDSLWENNGCKIDLYSNIEAPSIGVVEFDALDANGEFYGTYDKSVLSDILTSRPINLYYPGNQSIYLSFMYEPGGRKDMPELNDSLVLQFYSPVDSQWTTVWYALGGDTLTPQFKQVIIHVSDSKYMQKGFRFRFVAYSSLGSQSFPSLVSDCDFWYVDYVYLDRNRYVGDTIYRDIALQKPLQWNFDQYTAMPLDHYKELKQRINHGLLVKFRNNDGVGRTIDSLYIVFRNKKNNSILDTLYLGSYSFPPYGNFFVRNFQANYQFPQFTAQDMEIIAQTKLVTDQYDPKQNNQSFSRIDLINYYAYDDGSAEAGYGLYGDGTYQALVAARFYTYKDDYLRGVKIFFNKTYSGRQPRYFYLMVWENDPQTGLPGELIYEKMGMEIDFDHLGQFQTYYLDTMLRVTDTFYIGWKKTDEQLMNVGLDLNDVKPNYKFYNITGQWFASSIEGNLMIRPIMGHIINTPVENNNFCINIYPNPACDYVTIAFEGEFEVMLYDMTGRQVAGVKDAFGSARVDVTRLRPGIYIVRIIDRSGRVISRKLLIQ